MQELSLNVLDIAQNSVRAKASLVTITVAERSTDHFLEISIADNGCGMTPEQVARAMDPFFTTRTTRKVGLGISFFKLSAESTGGSFDIQSTLGVGTVTTARYHTDHIDMLPIGDMNATILSLISMNPQMDFVYQRSLDDNSFTLDTRELKAVLEDVPLNSPEVVQFIKETLEEGEAELTAQNT
ncbi:MAG TPA: ATP-binding protein [Candidatus Faecivivens stercorigallinarum]|nr:ATP-binding protein [Candidatus Faecivivens stercorigallinarum]